MRAMCHRCGSLTRKLFNNRRVLAARHSEQKDVRSSTGEKYPRPAFADCPRMPQQRTSVGG
jgi:hypothetical protein